MRISTLQLKNFKRFTDLKIEGIPASAKMVILVGPNGCGKSSVFEGLYQFYRAQSGHGIAADKTYAMKDTTVPENWQEISKVTFHDHAAINGNKRAMHFRTAYRNSSDFTVSRIERMGAPSEQLHFGRLIDDDSSVHLNYQRLIMSTMSGVFSGVKDHLGVPALRAELIGKLQESLRKVFDDLELQNIVDPFSDGTFYFKKGKIERYSYKNLSGGEKSAFDLLLDFHVTLDHFTDTVFGIDEPETHMHSALQAKLLEEIHRIVPEPSQIWISTHSLGVIRLAHRLETAQPGSVVVLDFSGHDFDNAVVIKPSPTGKILGEKILSVALEGHADDLMPATVVLCEGSFDGRRRRNFDAEVYSKIFAGESFSFLSGGSCNDLLNDQSPPVQIVESFFPGRRTFRLIDKDDRSPHEVDELTRASKIRVLSRRNLECFLLDDEILAHWIATTPAKDRLGEVVQKKAELLAAAAADPKRLRAPDDCKSISGELLVYLRTQLGLLGLGSTPESFMLHHLVPHVRAGTRVALSRQPAVPEHALVGWDAAAPDTPAGKAHFLLTGPFIHISQAGQLGNPDARIVLNVMGRGALLNTFAEICPGISPGDSAQFIMCFWEFPQSTEKWPLLQSSPKNGEAYTGLSYSINNPLNRELLIIKGFRLRGRRAWGKEGILIAKVRELPATRYLGGFFDANCAVMLPIKPNILAPLWAFTKADEFCESVRMLDQKLDAALSALIKVPFDLVHWQKVAAEKYPHGLPKPFSSDPTQWLFNGHPAGADQPLHVAVARLLGYQWPRQTGSSFPDCPALKADGLEKLADKDGIVCLSATKGEAPAADRLNALLAAAFGSDWSATKARELLAATDSKAKTLADWLSDDFFAQHCDLFHQRPFIWHIWDGLKGGFSALVNYHRLAAGDGAGKRTLDKLIFTYLGEWIDAQRKAQKAGVEGADARLTAAEHLSTQLKAILAGEPPFDLFVRWKPLHEQPIGWNPDINDGVRLNLRPFITAKPLNARGKNACILRSTPKVSWDKDRGKEPQRAKADFPWFWSWEKATDDQMSGKQPFLGTGSEPDGNRWNDCHYSTATKQAARDRHKK